MLAVRLRDSHINGTYLYFTTSKHKVPPPSKAFIIKLPEKWIPLFLSLWTAEREGHCALLLPDGTLLEDGNISFSRQHFNVSFIATTLYWSPMMHGAWLLPATMPRVCNWTRSCFLGVGTLRKRCWSTILSVRLWFRQNWWDWYSIELASRLRPKHCCPSYLLLRYLS